MAAKAKVGVVSLGCSKNRVDTELMLGELRKNGYEFVQDMTEADVILINTCSFIEDAREEAFGTILEAGQQKRYGSVRGIVVAGCLPQMYRERLRRMAPEVDVFLGTSGYVDIAEAVDKALRNERAEAFTDAPLPQEYDGRILTTLPPTAYVKIAEGCDNGCTYCVIPSIRGRFRSRSLESIEQEVWGLVLRGYTEIILIAQDTSRYGLDLYGENKLAELMDRLAGIPELKWLRVLYTYPENITPKLLDVMTKHDNIVKYIDMPVQHFSDPVLRRMNRTSSESSLETLRMIREAHPDFVVRSTVMVGFPGETREDFRTLRDTLARARFDRLGVFAYSQEQGTAAAAMEEQVDQQTKDSRRDALMNQQARISYECNRKRIGNTCEVLIEGFDDHSGCFYGRSYAEVPEVDGLIFVRSDEELEAGTFVEARVVQALNYDCMAELVPEGAPS